MGFENVRISLNLFIFPDFGPVLKLSSEIPKKISTSKFVQFSSKRVRKYKKD